MQVIRAFTALLLVLLATLANAAVRRHAADKWVDVGINPEGRITTIEWVKGDLGPHTAAVESYLRELAFAPPLKDDKPVAATTSLLLGFLVNRDDSTMVLDLVQPSPRIESTVPPRYPESELRRGREASVVLQLEYDASGTVTKLYKVGSEVIPESFVKASAAAALNWQLIPERLDGQPVAGSVLGPVAFKIERAARPARQRALRFGVSELSLRDATEPRQACLSQFRITPSERLPQLVLQLDK